MHWALFALAAALFQAGFVETNRHVKASASHLNFWHLALGALLSVLFLPWMLFPSSPLFYAAFVVIAAVSVVGCTVQMYMAGQKNGRVASMWMPVATFTSFFLWLSIDPDLLDSYLNSFVTMAGIAVAFGICVYALSALRSNDAGWRTFLMIAPVGVLYGFNGVVIKFIMPDDPQLGHFLTYSLLYYASSMCLQFMFIAGRGQLNKTMFDKRLLKGGIIIALFSFCANFTIVKAITMADNPAYAGAVSMTVPVWVMLYHKCVGLHDDADPKSGVLLVFGAILLAVVTA